MRVSDFHFDLPAELIAQHPPAVRGASRMLRLDRITGAYEDRMFAELPGLLQPGDLLVLNDSRVLAARLYATRAGLNTQEKSPAPSGRIEVLLTARLTGEADAEHNRWTALVKPAKKVQAGELLQFADADGKVALTAEVIGVGEYGERTLQFAHTAGAAFFDTLERIGHMPLPPYIRRDAGVADTPEDRARYQTVYARPVTAEPPGSAAAPTAGLHFTPEVLDRLRARGVEIAYVTLHVGLGTFQPVRAELLEDIHLHAERYTIPEATAEAINRARHEGRRIIAAGTTTTRTLEHCAQRAELEATERGEGSWQLRSHSGETSIFLSPGYHFRIVQGLITNFHLPESTLLMLVSALAGREHVLAAYVHAVRAGYRFFSYGDCMLIL